MIKHVQVEVGDVVRVTEQYDDDKNPSSRYIVREVEEGRCRIAEGRTDPGFWIQTVNLSVTYRPPVR